MTTDKKNRLILTGASGNVGNRIAKIIIPSYGDSVTLISRDKERLGDLMKDGARMSIGSMEDTTFLSSLFRNAETALVILPFPRHTIEFKAFQGRVGESLFEAIRGSSLKYIVHVSCMGAHRPDKTGPILGNYDLERRLNWLKDIHTVHLRPSFFMEGFIDFLSFDQKEGIITSPLHPETLLPMISVEDVAKVAAGYILKRSFRGQSIHKLPGPKALSMERIVSIIGGVINRMDLEYRLVGYDEAKSDLTGKGYSENCAESWISCFRYMNEEKDLFGDLEDETLNNITFEELAPSLVCRLQEFYTE